MVRTLLLGILGCTVSVLLVTGTDVYAQSKPKPKPRTGLQIFAEPSPPLSAEEQAARDAWIEREVATCVHSSHRPDLPKKGSDSSPREEPGSPKGISEESFMFQCLKNVLKRLGM